MNECCRAAINYVSLQPLFATCPSCKYLQNASETPRNGCTSVNEKFQSPAWNYAWNANSNYRARQTRDHYSHKRFTERSVLQGSCCTFRGLRGTWNYLAPGRDCGTFQCLQGKCWETKLIGIRAGAADPADRSEHRNESCVFPWMGSESSPEQFLEEFISEESVAAAENTTTELILGCSWWRVTETRGSFKMRWKLKYYTECDSVVTSFHPAAGPVSHPLNIILPLNSIFFSLTLL